MSGVSVGLECTERTDAECAIFGADSVIILEELEVFSVLFVTGLSSPTGVVYLLDVLSADCASCASGGVALGTGVVMSDAESSSLTVKQGFNMFMKNVCSLHRMFGVSSLSLTSIVM